MGGDHKCPVCQATFTRPQHVARHMRSHTGDRPYKCQFCGDQFARSDLLARHINKCHANEKPPANATASGRRKGSAAVSRATTSKQACDQCVQSSLPCDGSNPCSKCVSRKFRCTYVKFHRQTAPSGPGHHAPRSPSSSCSSLVGSVGPSRFPSFIDDYGIPTAPPVSAAYSGADQIFNTPFFFNPAISNPATYPPNWMAHDVPPFTIGPDVEATEKYRAQTELLRRSSVPMVSNGPTAAHPSIYATQTHQHHHYQPPSLGHWYSPAWGEPGAYPLMEDTKSFEGGIARTNSLASSEPASFAPGFYDASSIGSAYRPRRVSLDFSDGSSTTSQSVPSSAASSSLQLPLPEIYEGHSEEMQRQTHCHDAAQHRDSVPTSQAPTAFINPSEPVTTAAPTAPPPATTAAATQPPHTMGEGGFSSAFGLMSIDDPNVLAGLSSDGVPFFSTLSMGVLPNSPNATPMPARLQHSHHHLHPGRERGMSLGALPTSPGSNKEAMAADAKELREIWKACMRSPLSGSVPGSGTTTAAPDLSTPMSHSQMTQSPLSAAGQRRRMRVSSLPSVTPTVEKGYPSMLMNGAGAGAGGGSVRTTLHGNPEDLRSYEAAVNARSASLKLNLVPRRRGTRAGCGENPPSPPSVDGVGVSPTSTCSPAVGSGSGLGAVRADLQQGISRPSSSSSTSSLAQAFNTVPVTHAAAAAHQPHGSHSHLHAVKPPPMQGASISLPVPPSSDMSTSSMAMSGGYGHHGYPHSHSVSAFGSGANTSSSRASSVASDGTSGTGGSGSDGEFFRPSFKRYPSQTLGPASSKRALVERGAGMMSKGVKAEERGSGTTMEEVRESELGTGEGKWEREDDGGRENGTRPAEGLGFGERVTVGSATGSPGSRPIAALPERAKRGQTYY